jgi:hypothetical protein
MHGAPFCDDAMSGGAKLDKMYAAFLCNAHLARQQDQARPNRRLCKPDACNAGSISFRIAQAVGRIQRPSASAEWATLGTLYAKISTQTKLLMAATRLQVPCSAGDGANLRARREDIAG